MSVVLITLLNTFETSIYHCVHVISKPDYTLRFQSEHAIHFKTIC